MERIPTTNSETIMGFIYNRKTLVIAECADSLNYLIAIYKNYDSDLYALGYRKTKPIEWTWT